MNIQRPRSRHAGACRAGFVMSFFRVSRLLAAAGLLLPMLATADDAGARRSELLQQRDAIDAELRQLDAATDDESAASISATVADEALRLADAR